MRLRGKHQFVNSADIADPRQFFVDVALLIAQSREEFDKCIESRKRASYGLPQSSKCAHNAKSMQKELIIKEATNLFPQGIPTCLHVLVLPDSCSMQNSCIENAPVLERWTLCVTPRLTMKAQPTDQFIDGFSLQRAVKSHLHFSHLNSFLAKNGDKSWLTAICKARMPGESSSVEEPLVGVDGLLDDRHAFRPCLLDKSSVLHVSVESAPRTFDLNSVRCLCATGVDCSPVDIDEEGVRPSSSNLPSHLKHQLTKPSNRFHPVSVDRSKPTQAPSVGEIRSAKSVENYATNLHVQTAAPSFDEMGSFRLKAASVGCAYAPAATSPSNIVGFLNSKFTRLIDRPTTSCAAPAPPSNGPRLPLCSTADVLATIGPSFDDLSTYEMTPSPGCSAFNSLFEFDCRPDSEILTGVHLDTAAFSLKRRDKNEKFTLRRRCCYDEPGTSTQFLPDVHFFFPDDDDDVTTGAVGRQTPTSPSNFKASTAIQPPASSTPPISRHCQIRRPTPVPDDDANDADAAASSSDWSPSSPPPHSFDVGGGAAVAAAVACRRMLFGGDSDDAPSLLEFVGDMNGLTDAKEECRYPSSSGSNTLDSDLRTRHKTTSDICRRSFVPSIFVKKLSKYADKSTAVLRFNRRTGLPLSSSPAPITRNRSSFDFDSSLNAVSAIKKALQGRDIESGSSDSDASVPLCKSAPACTNLLGNFEESALNGRLQPFGSVDGFTLELGASGSFWPSHVTLPVTTLFFDISDDNAPSPYFGHCNLESIGKKGYCTPKKGTVQATLFNPQGTVVKMFVVRYDLTDMPPYCQTFVRQRTFFMPSSASLTDAMQNRSWLRYLIHLRFVSARSGRLYLHTDIRMLFSRKSELDAYNCEYDKKKEKSGLETYELRSFTEMPKNPKFSPRKCARTEVK